MQQAESDSAYHGLVSASADLIELLTHSRLEVEIKRYYIVGGDDDDNSGDDSEEELLRRIDYLRGEEQQELQRRVSDFADKLASQLD